jgi:hypothetical protein
MRASFLVILSLCLSSLCVAQLTPPLDSSCGASDCTAPETNCAAGAENCGTAPAGCGCQCSGCGSCVQELNPVFNKQCSANMVMVLDESGSIGCCTNTVRNAVISFISSFSSLNNIGGSATLGLVKFSNGASLVDPSGSCSGKLCTLDAAYVSQVTTYVQNSYNPGGCTNWAAALNLVQSTGWTLGGTVTIPDIVLFFTDGNPTVHPGVCNSNCNANRIRLATAPSTFVGACNGNHVGGACFWGDKIKKAGSKLFLVGIGDVTNHVPNTVLMTGPTAWDKQVGTFGTSDYVIDANYAQLGTLLNAVAKGVCPCLQDQSPCVDPTTPPAPAGLTCATQSNFDARVTITTGTTSATFPANAVLEAFMYYDFFGKPSRFALEYLQGTALARTDVVNPCNVQRQVSCGGACFTTADLGFVPRLFVASGDTASTGAGGLVPSNAACAAGSVFAKAGPLTQGQQIAKIWMVGGVACAARAVEGTLYEFWTTGAKTAPGVNYRNPGKPQQLRAGVTTPFNFDQFNGCGSPICGSEVEIVFVIDQNMGQSDYLAAQQYVKTIANSFDDANNRIRFGAYFSTASQAIPWQTQLGVFGNQVLATIRPATATSNFAALATNAINLFWPAPPAATDPPRYMITIVGSVDNPATWTAGTQTAFDTLRLNRKIEAWATGVDVGGSQFSTLISLSDSTVSRNGLPAYSYNHYVGLASSTLMSGQAPDQAARMCPRADLCGGTCQGLCLCGVCQCPTCAAQTDTCKVVSCPTQSSGCVVVDKASQSTSSGGCLPDPPRNPCQSFTCTNGVCNAATTPCGAGCGCTAGQVPACFFNDPTASCSQCTPKPVVCSGDLCGNACNPATGTCSGQGKVCDDGNGCSKDTCVIRLIGGQQQAVCQNTDDTQNLCPPADLCQVTNCTSTGPSSRRCTALNLTGLYDLCGVCNGDFTTCFFAAINPAAGGIAGGVVAGIVVGAIIAAALIAFFARQGYTAFMARSALAAPSAHTNPIHKGDSNAGYMPMN